MIKTDSEISRDFAFLAFLPLKRPLYLNLIISAQHNLGCSFFSILLVFHSGHSFYLNFDFQILIGLYKLVYNQHFVKLPKLCQIPPHTFWTESVLVWKGNFTLCCPPCGRWLRPWSPCLLPRQIRSPGRRGWPGTDRTTCEFPHFFYILVIFGRFLFSTLRGTSCGTLCPWRMPGIPAGGGSWSGGSGCACPQGCSCWPVQRCFFGRDKKRQTRTYFVQWPAAETSKKKKKLADLKQAFEENVAFFKKGNYRLKWGVHLPLIFQNRVWPPSLL